MKTTNVISINPANTPSAEIKNRDSNRQPKKVTVLKQKIMRLLFAKLFRQNSYSLRGTH